MLFSGICCISTVLHAQHTEIKGTVSGQDDIENIHVINKTSKRFTITNAKGQFTVEAKLNDTIEFSALQYTTKTIVIDAATLNNKTMHVDLNEEVNVLNEVLVGKVLTGNLLLDVQNSTAEPEINFYDVGIPGYTGKQKTQAERRLHEATTGGGIVPLNPILNGISGRTKMLKHHIDLERRDDLIHRIKTRLSHDFFSEHPLDESRRMDFLYFCADDPNFNERCKGKSDVEVLQFLNEKYQQYQANLKSD